MKQKMVEMGGSGRPPPTKSAGGGRTTRRESFLYGKDSILPKFNPTQKGIYRRARNQKLRGQRREMDGGDRSRRESKV
jgi:hypothetical protein